MYELLKSIDINRTRRPKEVIKINSLQISVSFVNSFNHLKFPMFQ